VSRFHTSSRCVPAGWFIKLDKSFVDEVTTSDQRARVATAVQQMADALGLIAVAELPVVAGVAGP
jgi:hypothetical protein